jgi:hypothetical protein
MENLRPREGAVSGEKVLVSKLLLKTTPPKAPVYTMRRGSCVVKKFIRRLSGVCTFILACGSAAFGQVASIPARWTGMRALSIEDS